MKSIKELTDMNMPNSRCDVPDSSTIVANINEKEYK